MKKVTMQTIADSLGISKSLVSLTLNDKYGVSTDMRYQIFKKALELGYDFNYNYSNKDTDHSRRICIFINKKFAIMSKYFGKFLEGAEKIFVREGYKYQLIFWDESSTIKDVFEDIHLKEVQGYIILKTLKKEILDALRVINKPVEFVDPDEYVGSEFTKIKMNNYQAGGLAISYLYEKGHRNIAYISERVWKNFFAERFYGVKDVLEVINRKHPIDPATLYYDLNGVSLEEDIKKIQALPIIPTALICSSREAAKLAISKLKEYNQYKDKKVSIVAIDGLDTIENRNESIITIKPSIIKIGEIAAYTIIYDIKYFETTKKTILIDTKLYDGSSDVNLKSLLKI